MREKLVDDLFTELNCDFPGSIKLHDENGISLMSMSGEEESARIVVMENLEEGIFHVGILWPHPTWGIDVIAKALPEKVEKLRDQVGIIAGHRGIDESYSKDGATFSGTVYLYAKSFEKADYTRQDARDLFDEFGYSLRIRDDVYREKLRPAGDWDVFISHDSNDTEFASALHRELFLRRVHSWYDEAELVPGDSLTEKIDEGLSKSQHAVLIVSEEFMDNVGWAYDEWQGIRSRSVGEDHNVIIPVWYDVSADEVREFSPTLAQLHAIRAYSVEDAAEVAQEIKQAID